MNNIILLIGIIVVSSVSLSVSLIVYIEITSLNNYFDSEIMQKKLVVNAFDKKFSEYAYTIQFDVLTDEPIRYLSITDYGMTAELILEKHRIIFNCYSDADTYLMSIINPQVKDIEENCHNSRF